MNSGSRGLKVSGCKGLKGRKVYLEGFECGMVSGFGVPRA